MLAAAVVAYAAGVILATALLFVPVVYGMPVLTAAGLALGWPIWVGWSAVQDIRYRYFSREAL